MITSPQIDQLATALAKAQGAMTGATKASDNPFFRSRYADLASVWDACRGPLTDHGLSITQFPQTAYTGTPELYEWTSRSGEKRTGVRCFCTVAVLTRLTHGSGQFMEDTVSTMLPTADPQAVGSAITYLRRYALQAIAGVAPEDDDAEATQRGPVATAKGPASIAAPAGYGGWLDSLHAAAMLGTPTLERAWLDATTEHRQYMWTTAPAKWTELKAIAARMISAPVSSQERAS
jgi:hypothetical protein